jgi:hypothetical protein
MRTLAVISKTLRKLDLITIQDTLNIMQFEAKERSEGTAKDVKII